MDRTQVWPDYDQARLLYEDEDLLAVDKAVGVPSQAVDPERPDDLVARLKAYFASQGKPTYLGVHQRLDRDTSGVLVLTRRKEANASIAAQFEGRRVEKRYLAGVVGWPAKRDKATLEDVLAPGDGGRMRVVPPSDRRGQHARTRVRVIERKGERALLELELETGRTHQARVQLAHAGAPLAGDRLYGGAMASRLMLHASDIALSHPRTQARVRFRAPVPVEFETWLARGDLGVALYDDEALLARAVAAAFERRFALGRAGEGPRATTAFRVIHEEGDALPRLAVDIYGDHLAAQFYDEDGLWTAERRARVLDRLAATGVDGVYVKLRPKQANVLVDTRREELAPRAPVRGGPAPDELVVLEEGVPYGVRLGDGLATGIYLDQRGNRRRVREMAQGKRVANLFAYTCAFSVVAAKGGARSTVSVDASVAALERGRSNFALAGLALEGHEFLAEDARTWMARAKARRERFELVILDPPSFSTTKRAVFTVEGDYVEVAAAAIALLSPGGTLLACSNHRKMPRAKFRRYLHEAARAAGRDVAQLKDLPDPLDFPAAPGRESYLKSALLTVGR